MSEFRFRSGKYKGDTLAEVESKNPNYIAWITENKPMMLEEAKPKKPKAKKMSEVVAAQPKWNALTPNMDFDNEPPDEGSLGYMRKHPEKYKETLEKYGKAEGKEKRD